MALTVATNTGALMAQAAASSVNKEMEISMERLSTGKRINGASDDAAGVAIASRLSSEIRGTNQAIRNALDGQAMIDTAEGAHFEIEALLQRMRELSVQSANDTNNSTDRANLQSELNALTAEINRISTVTTWAGQNLLTGTGGNNGNGTFKIQVGSQTSASDLITASINSMSAASLGVGSGNAVASATAASLSTVGGNVLQLAGSVASGDSFTFSLNGDAVTINIGDINASGDIAYTYTAVQGGSDEVESGGATFDTGSTADLLADGAAVIAQVIDNLEATTDGSGAHSGINATAASDGSVTITQALDVSVATSRVDGASSAASGASIVANPATGTTVVTFAAADLTYTASSNASMIDMTVNGEAIDLDLSTSDAYGDNIDGMVNHLQALFDAEVDNKGVSATVAKSGSDITVTLVSSVSIANVATSNALATTALDITSSASARTSIGLIDTAIQTVNSQRAALGAVSNRLDNTVSNLTNISNNLQAGRGRIEDADFAAETTNLARTQILQQASTAMLAQANAAKQNVLSLLQG
jgi:flagellin